MQQEFQSGTFSPAAKRKGRRRNVTLCKSWKLTQFEHFKGPWSHWSWSESWLRDQDQDCLRELFLEASHLPTHQVFSLLCADCDEDKLKHAPVHEHKAANLDYETKVDKTSDHPYVKEGDIGDSGNTLSDSTKKIFSSFGLF